MLTVAQQHILAVMLLLARFGDIGSTWLASPNLLLEANPVVRQLRWPFAFATLFLALLPYWEPFVAIVVLVASLMVTISNLSKVWLIRAMGEQEYFVFICQLAARSSPTLPLTLTSLSAATTTAIGGMLIYFYPSEEQVAYWFGVGFIAYAIVSLVYGVQGFLRLRRSGKDVQAPAPEAF